MISLFAGKDTNLPLIGIVFFTNSLIMEQFQQGSMSKWITQERKRGSANIC